LVAEGKKQSMSLEAEANTQSMILHAEAEQEAALRKAEGEAQAIREVQKAKADGISMIREAKADETVVKLRSLEAFEKAADGQSTKIIIPSDLQSMAGVITAATEVAKAKK
ncbi:MAG: peptidase, partial [Spirochaetales bacterium]|nr:peptidase [Spirochaetales bacterium]